MSKKHKMPVSQSSLKPAGESLQTGDGQVFATGTATYRGAELPVVAGPNPPGYPETSLQIMRAVFLARGSLLVQDVFRQVQKKDAPDALANLCEFGYLDRFQRESGEGLKYAVRFTPLGVKSLAPVLEKFTLDEVESGLANLDRRQEQANAGGDAANINRLGVLLGLMSQTVGAAMLAPSFRKIRAEFGVEFLRELVSEIQSLPVNDSWKRCCMILLKEQERVSGFYADQRGNPGERAGGAAGQGPGAVQDSGTGQEHDAGESQLPDVPADQLPESGGEAGSGSPAEQP